MTYTSYRENFRPNTIQVPQIILSTAFRVFLSLVALSLLILYVVRISTVSVKGYDISALQKQVHDLQEENQKLEFQIAKNSSMQTIQERLKSIHFVASSEVEFASLVPPVVAQR